MMSRNLPARHLVAEKVSSLINGRLTRESVSSWALSIVSDETYLLSDKVVWKALNELGGADLLNPEGDYLYADDDFADWLKSLS
jgi:hypothetical protein